MKLIRKFANQTRPNGQLLLAIELDKSIRGGNVDGRATVYLSIIASRDQPYFSNNNGINRAFNGLFSVIEYPY